jgi:hypothetical protein
MRRDGHLARAQGIDAIGDRLEERKVSGLPAKKSSTVFIATSRPAALTT